MQELTLVFISIIALFVLLLIVKQFFPRKLKDRICVLCTAVTITWVGLLTLDYFNLFGIRVNKTTIALLMGNTMLGMFYLAEKNVCEKWKLFRLPFYMMLLFVALMVLQLFSGIKTILLILGIIWVIFLGLYYHQNNENIRGVVKKIVDCCKNW